jgi:hypothetical protein
MAKFMTRVILHDAEMASAYDNLNAAMVQQGFARELPGKKAMYHLPLGEYWYQGDRTTGELRTLAAAAAETIGQDFGIVVVRVDGWSVMRLKKVEAAPRA